MISDAGAVTGPGIRCINDIYRANGERGMNEQRNYPGLDVLRMILAVIIVERHIIQIFFPEIQPWTKILVYWIPNLTVSVFFAISAYFLFRKLDDEHPDFSVITGFCLRIFKLYVFWCIIYLPIDFYNWYNDLNHTIIGGILSYFHHFLFESSIVQLWYLPGLIVACLIVGWLYIRHVPKTAIFAGGVVLFLIGVFGNNWYFNQNFPELLTKIMHLYESIFLTLRNGVFYGVCFVALGLLLAKVKRRPPLPLSVAGAVICIGLAYFESNRFFEMNFVFMAIPTAFFLFVTAEAFPSSDSRAFPVIRKMSEWIYFAHFYFFYFWSWGSVINPIPYTFRNLSLMIQISVLLFAFVMTMLSGTKRGKFLNRLI